MHAWESVSIAELGTTVTGRTPPTSRPELFGDDFPFVTPGDMDGHRTITHTKRGISLEGAAVLRGKRLPAGSVAVSCIGWQLGKAAIIGREAFSNQQLNVVIPSPAVDPEYLYYQLATRREEISSFGAVGTRTPILKKSAFERITIPLPPPAVQRNIVAILSAYDDLIENNNRRIKILEEIAQRTYRKWFVDFCYPGYEDVPLVDSELGLIPAGWEVRSFESLGAYINGFAFKPTDWGPIGHPIIKIRELKNGVNTETPRFAGALPAKYVISDGDLLFSWSADLNAYLWNGGTAWLNQHLFRVEPCADITTAFLFHALKERMEEFRRLSQGTTMRHIKRIALSQVTSVVPPPVVRHEFAEFAAPIDGLALALVRANRNASEARDLLLPRLMSGDVDVAGLDIVVRDTIG